jgi:membrane protein
MLLSFKDFYKDDGVFLSAALAFFSMLSIIPLSMFIVNILVTFTKEETIIRFIYNNLTSLFPNIEIQMIKDIKKLLMLKGISEISLILYGIFSIQLFTAIEFSLNKIFKVPNKRHFFLSLLFSALIVLLIIIAVGASFAFSYIVKLLTTYMIMELSSYTKVFLKYVVTFLLIFAIIVFLYKFLPNKNLKFSTVLIGSLITTVLIELAKHLFTFYVQEVIKISTLYGSLSTFLALLMWLFYAWAVFLYGAELINNLERGN